MKRFKLNKKTKQKLQTASKAGDALWDTVRQTAQAIAGVYFVYHWLFVSVDYMQDAWRLVVGGALLISAALEAYNINQIARNADVTERTE